MKGRLPIVLSATAVVIAALGSTSLGTAAGHAVAQTVTKAKAAAGLARPTVVPRRGRRGPRGFRGPRGPAGPAGPQGVAGIAGLTAAAGPASYQCGYPGGSCQVASSTATCPSGSYVVGGGFVGSTVEDITVYAARVTTTSYGVIAVNWSSISGTIQAQAICASGSGIQPSRVTEGSLDQMQRTLRAMREGVAGR